MKAWKKKYGIEPLLLETFVESVRFKGTCYQAANFEKIGETQGRGRQDSKQEYGLPQKDIYIKELRKNFRKILCESQIAEITEKKNPVDWIEEEFCQSELGDLRLRQVHIEYSVF